MVYVDSFLLRDIDFRRQKFAVVNSITLIQRHEQLITELHNIAENLNWKYMSSNFGCDSSLQKAHIVGVLS